VGGGGEFTVKILKTLRSPFKRIAKTL